MMTCRVAHWDMLDDSLVYGISIQGEDLFKCTKCHVVTFSMQEEVILGHTNGKCHLCTL